VGGDLVTERAGFGLEEGEGSVPDIGVVEGQDMWKHQTCKLSTALEWN